MAESVRDDAAMKGCVSVSTHAEQVVVGNVLTGIPARNAGEGARNSGRWNPPLLFQRLSC